MIKYESIQNKYYYNKKDVENIVKLIKNENYYNSANCTKEKVGHLIDKVNYFLDNITIKKEKVSLERHETEEEAREYFGSAFINTFDDLLTKLDKEQTIVIDYKNMPENYSMTIPSTVKCLADRAFNVEKNLKSVTIPGNIQIYGEELFAGCKSLSTVVLPQNIPSIARGMFRLAGIKSITLQS